jgi:hypothetical protein
MHLGHGGDRMKIISITRDRGVRQMMTMLTIQASGVAQMTCMSTKRAIGVDRANNMWITLAAGDLNYYVDPIHVKMNEK